MDMIPVTTEETMPSPVDPGEAAAEDEEVGDEADVEEDITSYAGRPQPRLTALERTSSLSFSPSSPWLSVLRLGIVRIFPSSECPVTVDQPVVFSLIIRCAASVFERSACPL